MKTFRFPLVAAAALMLGVPAAALAQAPPTAPLVLTQPSSARVTALAGAWVAGRDQDVIFHNPAQLIGARTDFSVSMARYGDQANMASLSSAYSGGKLSFTLGWGVQMINFRDFGGAASPFTTDIFRSQDTLLQPRASVDAQSMLLSTAILALPGLTVPMGVGQGGPTGVQLVAGRFEEGRLLDAAAAIESRRGPVSVVP